MTDLFDRSRVLFVHAHPDDETLATGGLIAELAARGVEVAVLTATRGILPIDRTGEELEAHPDFLLVASYNPGYQNILKTLKPSTRQRFVGLEFGFPRPEHEIPVVARESGLAEDRVQPLVRLANKLRAMKGQDLEEGISTRLVVYCASLIAGGMPVERAIRAAMIEPLTDDPDVKAGLRDLVTAVFG